MADDEGILDYTRRILVSDSIFDMFESYANAYGLIENEKISKEQIEHMVKRFEDMYQDYIAEIFKELDVQVTKVGDQEFIEIGELMTKVAGVSAAKLAVEILIIEILNSTVYA